MSQFFSDDEQGIEKPQQPDELVTQNFLVGGEDANTPILNQGGEKTSPNREPLKHLLIGSPKAVRGTIYNLQVIGYANVGDWSPLQRTLNPGEVMSILRRYILVQ